MIRRIALVASTLAAVAALAVGCNQDNSLVGGECAPGFVQCGLECVDIRSDRLNCGRCDVACASGVLCIAGACGGNAAVVDATDATISPSGDDAAVPDDAAPDAAPDAADASNAADAADAADDASHASDAGADAEDAATSPDGAPCTPPYDNVNQCGDCNTSCVAPLDSCALGDGGGYSCQQLCTAPAVNCSGSCVDQSSDPFNCGICGKFCASHLCVAGQCQGTTPGDVVYVGHDFATTPLGTAQGTVLQNAVFIAQTNPLRVFSYEKYADATALTKAKQIIGARATQLHRTVAYTTSTVDNDVPNQLVATDFDVLLVHDQRSAPPGALATLGTSWATTLSTFTKSGGIVVVLDGGSGSAEMPQFASSAALLQVASHTAMSTGAAVTVTAPGDDVGVGVLSPYGVWSHSARFTLSDLTSVTLVVRAGDGTGDPVVAHRVVQ